MSYPIVKNYLTANRSNKPLKAVGMVLHSTATQGATDETEVRYFDSNPDRQASAHGFVDWDSITNTVPYTEKAWHAGGTANSKFIGVELCEPQGHDVTKFNEVWKRATWYFAYIFVNVLKIKLVTKENLMSHAEVSVMWRESDHQDPVAYFKSYGKTVDMFRTEVQNQINIIVKENGGK